MIILASESTYKPEIIKNYYGKDYEYMYSLASNSDIPILPGFIVIGNNKTGKLDFYKEIQVIKPKDVG